MPNEGVGTRTAMAPALSRNAFRSLSRSSPKPARRRSRSAAPAYLFLVCGSAAAVLYTLDISDLIDLAAFVVVGLGAATALLSGPIVHRVLHQGPWRLLSIAAVAFLAGAIARPFAMDWMRRWGGAVGLIPDAFTVPGYLLMIAALAWLLRTRGGIQRYVMIDGLIIGAGAALASLLLLALPAATVPGRRPVMSVLAGLYPLFDVLLVLLVLGLAFSTAARRPSFVLLMGTTLLLLTGDLAYAVIGRSGHLTGPRLLDLPFLLGYTSIGASALHPSVVEVDRATPLPVQAWSWPRLVLLIPALAMPFVLIAVTGDLSPATRVMLAVGGATTVALLLVRAVSAVRDYASGQVRFKHQA